MVWLTLLTIAAADSASCATSDYDGDGSASLSCGGDDCNDDDPDVHPGAEDPGGDGEDQDCDGFDPPATVSWAGGSGGCGGLLLPLWVLVLPRRR